MSDHFDAVPDARHDITDLYVFQKPGDPTKSILILNVNPAAPTLATTFDQQASYEFKIDTNADARAEIAFHVVFTSSGQGQQMATVYRATGEAAEQAGPIGQVIIHSAPASFDSEERVTTEGAYRFYAGLRSDPFFMDREVFGTFQFTGHDAMAGMNVFGIVLELPNSVLGSKRSIGIWARTMAPVHGLLHQMDEMARPANNVFNRTKEDKHTFNGTPPTQQRALFLAKFVTVIQGFGYSEAKATQIALEWLPNILRYDYTSPAGYPNGRKLADDIADRGLSMMTRGRFTSDLVGPHTDYLADFPYLGPPQGS